MSEDYFERLVDEDALADFLVKRIGPAETYDVRRHAEGRYA